MKLSLVEDDEPSLLVQGIDVAPDRIEVEIDMDQPVESPATADHIVPRDAQEEYRLSQGDQLLNLNGIASHFGLKRHVVVERLRVAGIDPYRVNKRGAKYFWTSDVEDVMQEGTVQGKATEKAEEQTRKLRLEADLKELELDKRRGDSIDVSDVEQGATELFRSLHNKLTMYCDDSALDLSKLNTRGAVALYQKEHVNTILQELRDNPTNFVTKYLDQEAL